MLLARQRRSVLLVAIAAAWVLLAEAMLAVTVARNWHASWWEWHVLMLTAFAAIAVAVRQLPDSERFSELYLDEVAARHAARRACCSPISRASPPSPRRTRRTRCAPC